MQTFREVQGSGLECEVCNYTAWEQSVQEFRVFETQAGIRCLTWAIFQCGSIEGLRAAADGLGHCI